jgi:hypothetical protein
MARKLRAKSPAVKHNQAGATKMAEAVPQHWTLYNTHYILRAKSPTCDDNRRYSTQMLTKHRKPNSTQMPTRHRKSTAARQLAADRKTRRRQPARNRVQQQQQATTTANWPPTLVIQINADANAS